MRLLVTKNAPNQSSPLPIAIHQATIDDLDVIVHWSIELHRHEDDGDLAMHPDFELNIKKWLSLELNNGNSLFLIASINQQPVGFIFSTSVINDNGFLAAPLKGIVHLLWVDVEHRGRNIAAQLLSEIEKCLASIEVNYIECSYTANNQLAKYFWDNKGYHQRSITARKTLTSNLSIKS